LAFRPLVFGLVFFSIISKAIIKFVRNMK